jgi:hypothetical protein
VKKNKAVNVKHDIVISSLFLSKVITLSTVDNYLLIKSTDHTVPLTFLLVKHTLPVAILFCY